MQRQRKERHAKQHRSRFCQNVIYLDLFSGHQKENCLRPVLSQTINGKQSAVHLCGNVSERWQQKMKATAPTPSPLQQICKVTELNISFNHVKMSSSLLEVMQKRRYYQYQGFMRGIELLQNLIHDGVGQVGDHRQLHLPGEEQRKESGC